MKCLNNGHKTELPLIFGTMLNSMKPNYQDVFKIQLVADHLVGPVIIPLQRLLPYLLAQ